MIGEEIKVDGSKVKVVTKLPEEEKENNNLHRSLDKTLDIKEVLRKLKEDEKQK